MKDDIENALSGIDTTKDESRSNFWTEFTNEQFKSYLQTDKGLSPYSVRNYLTDMGSFLKFLNLEIRSDLTAVDRQFIRKYLYWLITNASVGNRTQKQILGSRNVGLESHIGYATRSVIRKLSVLRVFFAFLLNKGIISRDPTSGINSPRSESRLPKFLDREDTLKLLHTPEQATIKGLRNRAILEILYAAGLRVSELVGINLKDVDLGQGQVRVLGKGFRQRIGFLGNPAKLAVSEYLSFGRPKLCCQTWEKALFLNNRGGRLTQRSVQKIVKQSAIDAGVSIDVHTHTLRHTFATHLLDGGADIRVVQELLGHSSPATTEIYTHVTQASARKVYLAAHPRSGLQDRSLQSRGVDKIRNWANQ